MITAFVDMVGLLMVIPLLPFYAERMGGGGLWVGILVSAFSFAQLISAPLWGRVSDRYGRRPALLVGLGAAAIAYVIFAYADSLWILLASRLVQGAGGGTVGVVQAYVADTTEPRDRAKSLGWLSAATNAGVAIGPVMGGASLSFGREAPGLIAAGLCLVNMIFAWAFLAESLVAATPGETRAAPRRSREVVLEVLTRPGEAAPRLIWIYAIGMGAFAGFTSILALFLAADFGFTERNIGWVFMWNGIFSVIARAVLLGRMVDWLGEVRLARVGQTVLGVGLMLIPFTGRVQGGMTVNLPGGAWAGRLDLRIVVCAVAALMGLGLLRLARLMDARDRMRLLFIMGGLITAGVGFVLWRSPAPVPIGVPDAFPLPYNLIVLALVITCMPLGTAFTFPCVTALLSHVIDSRERGVVMGVQQSYGGVARVIAPLAAGWSWDALGHAYPFMGSAVLVLATLLLTFGIDRGRAPGARHAPSLPAPAPAAAAD
jgi:MFS family permease